MFHSLFGLLSQDLALDLGSANTRIHLAGAGVVRDVPSVIARRTSHNGRQDTIAVGQAARAMLGRTPDDVDAIHPIRGGQIAEFDAADAFLRQLGRGLPARGPWTHRRVVVAVPDGASELVRRALRDSCEALDAAEVHLLPRSLAAALGAGLPVDGTAASMIVDVGGGTTGIAVVCRGEVVSSTTLDLGGVVFDGAIVRWLRREHELLVGQPTAEALKCTLGAAAGPFPPAPVQVRGRCLRRGTPRAVEIDAASVCEAMTETVEALASAIRRAHDATPTQIANDISERGVLFTGGGSRLRRLDRALREATGLAVLHADHPEHAVIRGAGHALEHRELLQIVEC